MNSYISLFANLNEKEEFRIMNFQIALEDLQKNVLKMLPDCSPTVSESSGEDPVPETEEPTTTLALQPSSSGSSLSLHSIKKRLTIRPKKEKEEKDLGKPRQSTILSISPPFHLKLKSDKHKSKLYAFDTLPELAVLLRNELDLSPFSVGSHVHKRTFTGNFPKETKQKKLSLCFEKN